jgi:hypothetical protein
MASDLLCVTLFTTRSIWTPAFDKIEIINTCFRDCAGYSDNGGAVYANVPSCTLSLDSSFFSNCSTLKSGGAIWFIGHSVQFNGFIGDRCNAADSAFCHLQVAPRYSGLIEFNESSGALGKAKFSTFHLWYPDGTHGDPPSLSIVRSLNSTANFADTVGSGLDLGEHYLASTEFCTFSSNSDSTVLSIYEAAAPGPQKDTHACLSFFNNTVDPAADRYSSLISVYSTSEFMNCVFVANSFGLLVGRPQEAPAQETQVTLTNCLFAEIPPTWNSSVSLITVACSVVSGVPTIPFEDSCGWPSPSHSLPETRSGSLAPSQTRSSSPEVSSSEALVFTWTKSGGDLADSDESVRSSNAGLIAGAVVGGIAVCAAIVILVAKMLMQKPAPSDATPEGYYVERDNTFGVENANPLQTEVWGSMYGPPEE